MLPLSMSSSNLGLERFGGVVFTIPSRSRDVTYGISTLDNPNTCRGRKRLHMPTVWRQCSDNIQASPHLRLRLWRIRCRSDRRFCRYAAVFSCEVTFLDDEAERLKHDAVCQHFGVLTPTEIRRIRESYGMTRAAFARVTGLGEATLNRWETGIMIQTLANDRYLRLLASPATMQRLKSFGSAEQSSSSASTGDGKRFR